MRLARAAIAAALVLPPCAPAVAQDVARGEALFETCKACHSLDPAKAGMAGPHLAGMKARVVASAQGFDYSPALLAGRTQKLVWDEARLNDYLADPNAMFRGSWMSAPGLDDAAERAAVVAFLMRGK